MSFESAQRYEEEHMDESIESPMSGEILELKNDIQRALIMSSITSGEDVGEYPGKWIDQYHLKFRKEFTKMLQDRPNLKIEWENDENRPDIVADFKRRLYLNLTP